MVRMIIADDEPMMRKGLQTLEWREMGFEVIGIAENGLQAYEMIAALQPDLILTDIRMPGLNGIS
ncbi:response regulator [Paenibacillus sp. N3.4]|uniref:response regulator n=1 Tax=Paenibacillus sp. N3.4 TaxID=2603222 RepID=UPI0011CBCE67|nr:response regulator [Paenibacillus sp. N3.4]TXK80036.1 response regulator [Paenibacillus sp. N3.4]